MNIDASLGFFCTNNGGPDSADFAGDIVSALPPVVIFGEEDGLSASISRQWGGVSQDFLRTYHIATLPVRNIPLPLWFHVDSCLNLVMLLAPQSLHQLGGTELL